MTNYRGNLMRFIPLLCICLVQTVVGQTSIVAVRLNNQVVVGADSKRVRGDQKIAVEEPVCKIGIGDGFYFASAGLAYDTETGFSVASIITSTPKSKGTIEQKVERLEETIKGPLTEILDRYRRNYPVAYERRFRTGSALQIIFFGTERNSTIVLARDFVPTSSALTPVQISVSKYKCPGDCRNGEQIFKLGRYDAIDRFLAKQPEYWKRNSIQAVRKLIELEIADVPSEVGPPIDILRINKNGAQWVQKKKQCADNQKQDVHKDAQSKNPKTM